MDQIILHQEQTKESTLLLGTVVAYDTTKGVRIQLDGEETAGSKYYKTRKGMITAVGDRVVLAPISGSCASWINTIIEALTAQGLMSKNGW